MKPQSLLLLTLLHGAAVVVAAENPARTAPFTSSPDSLRNYRASDWFRDAKFGIWSHWGPQAVPRQGDWYARRMYLPGDRHYRHHLQTYGHPSKDGFKDIIPLWKAEKWDPEALMDLYVQAGAKYFVSMSVHHDNFDLWNSKYHAWNAVQMGPRRDVVGEWKRAAKKRGLRFGVSEHLGASYTWFQGSHGADRTGPLAGVPYDGADPKWAALYHPQAVPDDRGWYSKDAAFQTRWTQRITDLLNNYQLDLLYSDGGIPFGEVGRSLIAHFYNSNCKNHGGKLEAVYNYKNIGSGEVIEGAGVLDVERGALAGINPLPWQTDTSIGDWFYSDGYRYKTAPQLIHSLADIVSKNGNLLINEVQYPDGSLPPESQTLLREMAAWIPLNGEAIYGTRPWLVFGEGPARARAGNFNENTAYTAQDLRFTVKKGAIYVLTMGVPTGKVVIRALASASPLVSGVPSRVELLGHRGQLRWTRTEQGLEIQLPPKLPLKHSLAFKISGFQTRSDVAAPKLKAFSNQLLGIVEQPAIPLQTVEPGADGAIMLTPGAAQLSGDLRVEGAANLPNIGYWSQIEGTATWQVKFASPGTYQVAMDVAASEGTDFIMEFGDQQLLGKTTSTGDWNTYRTLAAGEIKIAAAGTLRVKIRSVSPTTWRAFNLRAVRLVKRN